VTLRLEDKKAIVAEVAEVASDALSLVAADYCGLTVSEMTELRSKARDSGVYLRVVRNTLAKRALADTDFACISDSLSGPLALAFSQEDPGAAARVIHEFVKTHDTLEVKALSMDGQLLAASDLARVASLPTREQAISMLMSVMQAPISKLVRTLAAPQTKFVRTLAAVKDKKDAA
jgi:large subunit ribosomal protein L10